QVAKPLVRENVGEPAELPAPVHVLDDLRNLTAQAATDALAQPAGGEEGLLRAEVDPRDGNARGCEAITELLGERRLAGTVGAEEDAQVAGGPPQPAQAVPARAQAAAKPAERRLRIAPRARHEQASAEGERIGGIPVRHDVGEMPGEGAPQHRLRPLPDAPPSAAPQRAPALSVRGPDRPPAC